MKFPIILIFSLLLPLFLTQTTPDFVLELFRHGARSPLKTKFSPAWDDLAPLELNSVGMRQQYLLGKALKQKYSDLLLPFNSNKLYVYSTGKERALMSAAAQLYGIYEGSGPELPPGISNDVTIPPWTSSVIDEINSKVNVTNIAIGGFQPIPIHSSDPQFDYLLQSFLRCPNLDRLYRRYFNDDKVQKMYGEYSEVIEYLKTKDIEIKNVKDLKEIADVALASKYYGKELPGNIPVDSQMYRDLEVAASWFDVYPVFAETIQRQIFSAPMFSDLIDYIDGIRDGSSKTKFVIWAGAEASLFSLLIALDVVNFDCLDANWKSQRAGEAIKYPNCVYPGFASSLIFEFYNQTKDPFVVFRYSDREISLCGENKNCTLSEFKDLVNKATDNNRLKGYYKVCGVPEEAQLGNHDDLHSEKMYSKEVVFGMGAIIAVLVIIVAVLLAKRQQNPSSISQSDKEKSLLKFTNPAIEEL